MSYEDELKHVTFTHGNRNKGKRRLTGIFYKGVHIGTTRRHCALLSQETP